MYKYFKVDWGTALLASMVESCRTLLYIKNLSSLDTQKMSKINHLDYFSSFQCQNSIGKIYQWIANYSLRAKRDRMLYSWWWTPSNPYIYGSYFCVDARTWGGIGGSCTISHPRYNTSRASGRKKINERCAIRTLQPPPSNMGQQPHSLALSRMPASWLISSKHMGYTAVSLGEWQLSGLRGEETPPSTKQ